MPVDLSDVPSAGTATPAAVAPLLISLERPPEGRAVEIGALVSVSVVEASNIVRDVREMITNLFGGRMRRYELLLDRALGAGLAKFRAELAAQGYDGALGVRFSHPSVVMGGAELIVYGTGFRFRDGAAASGRGAGAA